MRHPYTRTTAMTTSSSSLPLTAGFVAAVHNGNNIPEPVLQILAVKQIFNQPNYWVALSDGQYYMTGVLASHLMRLIQDGTAGRFDVIKLLRYQTQERNGCRLIIINDMVRQRQGLIGNPQKFGGDPVPKPTLAEAADPVSYRSPMPHPSFLGLNLAGRMYPAPPSIVAGNGVVCPMPAGFSATMPHYPAPNRPTASYGVNSAEAALFGGAAELKSFAPENQVLKRHDSEGQMQQPVLTIAQLTEESFSKGLSIAIPNPREDSNSKSDGWCDEEMELLTQLAANPGQWNWDLIAEKMSPRWSKAIQQAAPSTDIARKEPAALPVAKKRRRPPLSLPARDKKSEQAVGDQKPEGPRSQQNVGTPLQESTRHSPSPGPVLAGNTLPSQKSNSWRIVEMDFLAELVANPDLGKDWEVIAQKMSDRFGTTYREKYNAPSVRQRWFTASRRTTTPSNNAEPLPEVPQRPQEDTEEQQEELEGISRSLYHPDEVAFLSEIVEQYGARNWPFLAERMQARFKDQYRQYTPMSLYMKWARIRSKSQDLIPVISNSVQNQLCQT